MPNNDRSTEADTLANLALDKDLELHLSAVYGETSGLFHNLVAAAGLNPASDFRARDLKGMNFAGADLRGFDFSNSDLRGTCLRQLAIIDKTTKIIDANLDTEDQDWLNARDSTAGQAREATLEARVSPTSRLRQLAKSILSLEDASLSSDIEPFLVTGGEDGSLQIIDIRTRKPLRVFQGHQGTVTEVGAVEGCKSIFSCSSDGTVIVWDSESGSAISRFRWRDEPSSRKQTKQSYVLGSKRLVTGTNSCLALCHLIDSGFRLYRLDLNPLGMLRNSQFDATDVVGGDDLLAFGAGKINTRTAEIDYFEKPRKRKSQRGWFEGRRLFPSDDMTDSSETSADPGYYPVSTTFCRFADNGRLILRCTLYSYAEIWDVQSWRMMGQFPVIDSDGSYRATCAALSTDKKYIAVSSSKGTVALWNVNEDILVWSVPMHRYSVTDLRFSPDGARILSLADDGSMRVSSVATGSSLQRSRFDKQGNAPCQVTSDGRYLLAMSGSRSILLRRLDEKQRFLTLRGLFPFDVSSFAVLDHQLCGASQQLSKQTPFLLSVE